MVCNGLAAKVLRERYVSGDALKMIGHLEDLSERKIGKIPSMWLLQNWPIGRPGQPKLRDRPARKPSATPGRPERPQTRPVWPPWKLY
jgi:hypothetical protein